MAFGKKKSTDEFRVPSLAEASPAYSALLQKQVDLQDTVTITPATSTINGASTLVLAQNMGAFIWSDGTNYHAAFMPVTKPILAGNNLSDLASPPAALTNLGGTSVGKALFTATDAAAARAATGVDKLAPNGHLYGLTLSNNVTDATNDIDIAVGEAADANGNLMVLSSGITKRLDAVWVVGTNQGGLDTGSIANTTYHVWLIQRSDTGVTDALFSTSATAPTMPANYDRKRRIGSIIRASGAIRQFLQQGDLFRYATGITDYSSTALVTDSAASLSVPSGVSVNPIITGVLQSSTAGTAFLVGDGNSATANFVLVRTQVANEYCINTCQFITTNIATIRVSVFTTIPSICQLITAGWIDTRGRLG